MNSIDIEPKTIGEEILIKPASYRKFRIPDYQRNYVRDDERIDEFWQDLTERKTLPFLGSFIVKDEGMSSAGFPIIDIVDGQQRTITIAIFLAALRNKAKEIGEDYFSKVVQRCIEVEKRTGGRTGKYFIECRPSIQNFFEENFLNYNGNIKNYKGKIPKIQETLRNMKKNYNHVYEELDKYLTGEGDVDKLETLLDKILNYEIVVIKVRSDEEAYIAFEIVNASGVKLENVDLLKNLFIQKSYDPFSNEEQEKVKKRWNEMTENIKNSATKGNVESFLKHFWSTRYGYTTGKDLYAKYKSIINKGVGELSQTMLEDSELYFKFGSPDGKTFVEKYEYNSSIIRSLNAIKIFGVTQAYIFF